MKESINFDNEDIEKTSLNFSELRQKGLDYIQELSSENWTDFNSHDPGVTILEQLCYALTDVSLRTSNSMNDLLASKTNKENKGVDASKNAFHETSEIYRTHPVTILDLRKILIDEFYDIQNVWIKTTENNGLSEKLVLTERIEILSKSIFSGNTINSKLEDKVRKFIAENRNLGDDVENICFLKPRYFSLKMEVHLVSDKYIDKILANLFMAIFEYVYTPVSQHNLEEMIDSGYEKAEILSGPKLKNGFIKNDSLKDRRIEISKEWIQENLSLVKNIYKCKVTSLKISDTEKSKTDEYVVDDDEFFHLFKKEHSNGMTIESFETLYNSIKVLINDTEIYLSRVNKKRIHQLFYELWTKKYGPYALRDTLEYEFYQSLKGTNYELENYYSIQNHFPLIYAIGKEGLTNAAAPERRAKAKQLKGYLLFFEQYLANHLSQISHVDDFFSIDDVEKQTYFSQSLNNDNVPNIDSIHAGFDNEKEEKNNFFDRKNRIYSHLLARFGEDLNSMPWKLDVNNDTCNTHHSGLNENLRQKFLKQKANFLKIINNLSAESNKGEIFLFSSTAKRKMSVLEKMIIIKTGIKPRDYRSVNNEENTNNEELFIVDHILLRDFFNKNKDGSEVTYGFKIIDAKDQIICETIDDQFCGSEKDRNMNLDELFKIHEKDIFFSKDDLEPSLQENTIEKLVTFTDNPKTEKPRSRSEIKELGNLLSLKNVNNASTRLYELEKIRAKGIHEVTRGDYGQRRLIFQRKLKGFPKGNKSVTIDEDFFNLSISVVLPNWPKRFENPQFKAYMEDLIIERVPSHIKVNILWIEEEQMTTFKVLYLNWENLKVTCKSGSEDLRTASYEVYEEIREMKKNAIESNKKEPNNA